ncbi:hypothetical protein IFM89_037189 [Coptis chinensis]|uniref:Uncharacterized protein n=1 Tax=Coptis chinensis TaxID=261450 RepID=A0A835HQ28_9MAGN|nr:hypothetical protein IFM89_037189 [Coptis chinensis]
MKNWGECETYANHFPGDQYIVAPVGKECSCGDNDMFDEYDTQDAEEDTRQLARVTDLITSEHIDAVELTIVLLSFSDISMMDAEGKVDSTTHKRKNEDYMYVEVSLNFELSLLYTAPRIKKQGHCVMTMRIRRAVLEGSIQLNVMYMLYVISMDWQAWTNPNPFLSGARWTTYKHCGSIFWVYVHVAYTCLLDSVPIGDLELLGQLCDCTCCFTSDQSSCFLLYFLSSVVGYLTPCLDK